MLKTRHGFVLKVLPVCLAVILQASIPAAAEPPALADLNLETLMNLEVTSVSRRKSRSAEAAAALYVVTADEIRRSGATSIPEALRLVPGLHVARLDTNSWAITSRGFNSRFANKLLVMIDGRTVYTPLFSGVFWSAQDTLLEDVERIEVIRGPGSAVWGSNAVNGVINIITKSSKDTQGGLVSVGAGNEERFGSGVRYGEMVSDDASVRLYGKYFKRDKSERVSGGEMFDQWEAAQAGFRFDWKGAQDAVAFQGDIYGGYEGLEGRLASPAPPYFLEGSEGTDYGGGNLLVRWQHEHTSSTRSQVQLYYDRANRADLLEDSSFDTYDIDTQLQIDTSSSNTLLFGFGSRTVRDDIVQPAAVTFDPSEQTRSLNSAFVQDELDLFEGEVRLILGSKFEQYDSTGFEAQPTGRIAWLPDEDQTVWAAVSRAARLPSRAEETVSVFSGVAPLPDGSSALVAVEGSREFGVEELLAYEVGHRIQSGSRLAFDTSIFYNEYDDTLGTEAGLPEFNSALGVPVIGSTFANSLHGRSWGGEFVVNYQPFSNWQLQGWYSYLDISLVPDAGSTASEGERDDPVNQFAVRSLLNVSEDVEFDSRLRWVDNIAKFSLESYFELDLRLAWRPYEDMELALIGTNLLQPSHPEYVSEIILTSPAELERAVFGKMTLRF